MPPRSAVRFALLILPLVATPALGEETLRWKFAEGDTHRYELNQTTVNTAMVQEQQVKTSIFQTVEMTWEVRSVDDDGSARLAQTIDRVRVALESQFADFVYDSRDEAAAEGPAATLKPVIDALVGSQVILVMSPRGEVRDVEVPEEMLEKLRNAGPAADALQNLASAEGMKGLIGQSTLVLPEEAVDEGSSWERQVELPTPQGTMALTNTFTYEGIEGSGDDAVAKIGVSMNIDEFQADPDAPFQMRVEEQEGNGTYAFDASAGLLRSSEVKQTLNAIISVMGQEITSIADSTATFKRAED